MNSLITIQPRSLSEHASNAQGIRDIGLKNSIDSSRRWNGSRRRARSSQSRPEVRDMESNILHKKGLHLIYVLFRFLSMSIHR